MIYHHVLHVISSFWFNPDLDSFFEPSGLVPFGTNQSTIYESSTYSMFFHKASDFFNAKEALLRKKISREMDWVKESTIEEEIVL